VSTHSLGTKVWTGWLVGWSLTSLFSTNTANIRDEFGQACNKTAQQMLE